MTHTVPELAEMTLPEIVEQVGEHPSSDRLRSASLACLVVANSLRPDDLALPDFRVAAQTFATLSVSATLYESLVSGAYGSNVADAILQR